MRRKLVRAPWPWLIVALVLPLIVSQVFVPMPVDGG